MLCSSNPTRFLYFVYLCSIVLLAQFNTTLVIIAFCAASLWVSSNYEPLRDEHMTNLFQVKWVLRKRLRWLNSLSTTATVLNHYTVYNHYLNRLMNVSNYLNPALTPRLYIAVLCKRRQWETQLNINVMFGYIFTIWRYQILVILWDSYNTFMNNRKTSSDQK